MVEVTGVSKSYGKKRILNGISFSAKAGEQIALVGRNGCGKSTLIKIMAGLIKPDHGEVSYFGKILTSGIGTVRTVGYLPQDNPLMDELTVLDNLSMWAGKRIKLSDDVVGMFDLGDILKEPVYKLSGGMKRRLAIACACVHMPPVMLMDEPTASLDIYYREDVRRWMRKYREMNGCIVVVTHDSDEISDSSKSYLIEDGSMRDYY